MSESARFLPPYSVPVGKPSPVERSAKLAPVTPPYTLPGSLSVRSTASPSFSATVEALTGGPHLKTLAHNTTVLSSEEELQRAISARHVSMSTALILAMASPFPLSPPKNPTTR